MFRLDVKNQPLEEMLLKDLQKDLQKAGLNTAVIKKQWIVVSRADTPETTQQTPITVKLQQESNYYFAVFQILQAILPDSNVEHIVSDFHNKYSDLEKAGQIPNSEMRKKQEQPLKTQRKSLNLRNTSISLMLTLLATGLFYFGQIQHHIFPTLQDKVRHSVRSSLSVPIEPMLLHRPNILVQMEQGLKGNGIQVIALVGIGGAGKTTLARQFARQQSDAVVWEMNAETQETLADSFEALAFQLANSDEDRAQLREMNRIEDSRKRTQSLALFVQQRLRSKPNWLLIYDNLDSLQEISGTFPMDSLAWGNGRVILTSRNTDIKTHNEVQVHEQIHVGPLPPRAQRQLLNSILNCNDDDAKTLLASLPPYPLDISLAARYIQANQISCSDYLKQIDQSHQAMDRSKIKLLNQLSSYHLLRSQIIELALNKILEQNSQFEAYLQVISCIDSQNIPIELLRPIGKNFLAPFLQELHKHELVTEQKIRGVKTLSFHRYTHQILCDFMKTRSMKYRANFVDKIKPVLDAAISSHCIDKMKLLKTHLETLVAQGQEVKEIDKATILRYLGETYLIFGHYPRAEKNLKRGLLYTSRNADPHNLSGELHYILAKVLTEGSRHEEALAELKLTQPFRQNMSHAQSASINALRGYVYLNMGQYTVVKDYLAESLALFQTSDQKCSQEHAWALMVMGFYYHALGDDQKAESYYQRSLDLSEKVLPNDHIQRIWALSSLGAIEVRLKKYQQSRTHLTKAYQLCKKHFGSRYIGMAGILTHLANLYRDTGHNLKAEEYYKESLKICRMHVRSDDVRILRILVGLAKIASTKKNVQQAKAYLEQAEKLSQTNTHPEVSSVYELLAELHFDPGEAQNNRALTFLNKALKVLQTYHPKDSPHRLRIEERIQEVTRLM